MIRLSRMQPGDEAAIRICPYDERVFPPLTLLALWNRLQSERLSPAVWRYGEALSLNEFIRFFGPTEPRVLFLPFYQPDDNGPLLIESVMGMCWIDEFRQPEARAAGHFAFFRQWWGGWPDAAIRKTLRECVFAPPLSFKMVVCQGNADNTKASALWDRLGIHRVGTVPDWYLHMDGTHGADFGYILASDYIEVENGNITEPLGVRVPNLQPAVEEARGVWRSAASQEG
jgi:hypothetical protein